MTDDGDLLSRLDFCAEIMDHDVIRIISECDVLELNGTFYLAGIIYGIRPVSLLFLFKELEHSLSSRSHGLHLVHNLSDLLDRLSYILDILDERLDIPDTNRTPYAQDASGDGNAGISEVAHYPHERTHHARQELGFPCGFI